MTMTSLVEKHPLKEKRKANKPLLERKRRARINDSLSELKQLVLTSLNKDISRFSKMEKADVLDMTVQYLKASKLRQSTDDNAVSFRAGFNECASEIIRYIMRLDDVDNLTKAKLLSYLATSCKLSESTQNTDVLNSKLRVLHPVTCSVSSQSGTAIIPSPTPSSPQSTFSSGAFSPPRSTISHANDRTIFPMKQLTEQISPIVHHPPLLPKVPLTPNNFILTNAKTTRKPKLWRPW